MSENKTSKPERVALWAKGLMRGVITRAEAEQLVKEGKYRWIHDGAIDWIEAGEVSSRISERLRYLADEEREKATNIPSKSSEFTYTVGLANGLRMAAAIVEREFKA